ncbi:protein lin-52 homolog isoform X1 [Moschus berezovskii]|uniref:protein lin-52 homolog isoform X1 n=1 Tax=Moschus berezovskii TaxID=68408 RepID=UPI002443A409|nr:protein lin-52 homolog isoform X1 [Moschus berezovskii]
MWVLLKLAGTSQRLQRCLVSSQCIRQMEEGARLGPFLGKRTRVALVRLQPPLGEADGGGRDTDEERRRLSVAFPFGRLTEKGADLEASLLSFEKLDRASPDLWPEQLPGVAEFAASFKSPITSSPPKWMAEIERDDIDMLKELGSLTTANLMEKVRGLQNLAYQLGLDESREMTRGKFLNILEKPKK